MYSFKTLLLTVSLFALYTNGMALPGEAIAATAATATAAVATAATETAAFAAPSQA
ncbi:hypothetical protein PQX77_005733 [Marasmius sp. AFHP31]|nr:hypothetical protein PQX77_005733 [Marasmius sp. AFHP31]